LSTFNLLTTQSFFRLALTLATTRVESLATTSLAAGTWCT
jgi:hypothetical protein